MEEGIEFDEAIAEDIGVGSDAFFVAGEDIFDDLFLVFFL